MVWNNLEFTNPGFLWFLLVIPILAAWYFFTIKKDGAYLKMASTKGFAKQDIFSKLKPLLYVLRLLAVSLLIIALDSITKCSPIITLTLLNVSK